VLRHLRNFVGATPFRLVPIQGTLAGLTESVRAVYCGTGTNQSFLADLIFDRWETGSSQMLPGGYAVRTACRRISDAHIVLTDLPPLWAWMAPAAGDIRFPAWMRQELQLPADASGSRRLLPRPVEREAARYRRRHDYRVDFTTDRAAMREFFHHYYQPYIRTRFGTGAIAVSEHEFLARAGGQVLARLHRGADWVMGVLLAHRGHTLRFGWFGAREDPPPPGASDVLDLACIERAHADGAHRIVLGHSRPVLTDGVVRYKSKFGARLLPTRFPQATLAIELRQHPMPIIERLNAHQIVSTRGRHTAVMRLHVRERALRVEWAALADAPA
jgi:hypothetical protein